jgi:hypothetical protein
MEVTLRRGRRRKKLLDDLKEKRGYWKLKEDCHYEENSLCKKLYTSRKTDYGMNDRVII